MEREASHATPASLQRQFLSVALGRLWPQLRWETSCHAVLDVGCGPGDVTALELLPRLPAHVLVVAGDPSEAALAHAAEKFREPRLHFLPLHIGSRRLRKTAVCRLGPYSKVFSFFSLHLEQHQRRAIKNISNLLCSGGETVLVLISRTILFTIYTNLAMSTKWSSYFKDCQQLSPYQYSDTPEDDLNIYLQQAGLTVKTCYEQDILYVCEKESGVRETLAAINPFLSKVPVDKREDFQQESVEAAFKNGGVTARQLSKGCTLYSLKYSALVAHAIKM